MFEIVLNNKKSKYRDKPVMNIDVDDPCSWKEVKDKPETLDNIGHLEQRVSDVELSVKTILDSAKSYADEKDTTTLADAKSYADEKGTTTLADAKTYTDEKGTTTLADAKSYTDEKGTTTLASAKSYADEKDTTTLASAKSYADEKVNNISYIKSSSIPTSGWTTKTGYYEINITVSGLDVANASVIIDADTSGTTAIDTITNIDDSWSKIVKIVASTNKLYVVATELPSIAIPVKIRVDRHIT